MSTSGGKKRGPHARMLVEGMGVQPKQAWWSRPAKAVVQRLWRPRGTGCMCCVCALCADAMHLADTYPHVTQRRSPVMRCVSSVACVASSSSHGHQCSRARVSPSLWKRGQFGRRHRSFLLVALLVVVLVAVAVLVVAAARVSGSRT